MTVKGKKYSYRNRCNLDKNGDCQKGTCVVCRKGYWKPQESCPICLEVIKSRKPHYSCNFTQK